MVRGGIEGWHCRWKDVILAIYGFLVQMIIPVWEEIFLYSGWAKPS